MVAAREKLNIVMIGQKGMPASWGGVEQHVHHLALEHIRRGHSVTVYSRSHYANKQAARVLEAAHPGLSIVFLPTIPTKHFDAIISALFATLHALIVVRPSVFHYHSVGPSLVAFLARLFAPRSRTVVTFHSPDREHAKWGRFARFVLTLAERTALFVPHETITPTLELQEYCRTVYGVETTFIPNGMHLQKMVATLNEKELQVDTDILSSFGIQSHQYSLVVARFVPHKGIHLAIEAWKKISTQKKLVIVGEAVMGTEQYAQDLYDLAAGDDRIVFVGFQTGSAMEALYRHAYVVIQPSFSEGLSIALLESASYGKGIVSSDLPANLIIVQHGGFVFEQGNAQSLAEELEYVLRHPHAVKLAGRSVRNHIAAEFQWKTIAEKIIRVYYHGNAKAQTPLHESTPATIR